MNYRRTNYGPRRGRLDLSAKLMICTVAATITTVLNLVVLFGLLVQAGR